MQIAPSIYFYPFTSVSENNCNTIVINGPEKIIIDPGHKHLWPKLKAKIEADGIDTSEIKLVLHTHCHPDHIEAGEILEFDNKATQAMHSLEAEFLNKSGLEFFPLMGLDYPTGNISSFLEEGPLEIEDKNIAIYLTPGHTPGGICLHLPDEKVLITGDLIFARSIGRSDFVGGDHNALAKSVKRMQELNNVEIILPGHGPAIIGLQQVKNNFESLKKFFSKVI